jgi:hypothetical protein
MIIQKELALYQWRLSFSLDRFHFGQDPVIQRSGNYVNASSLMSYPNQICMGYPWNEFLPYCDYPPSVDQFVDPKCSSASSDPKLSFAIVSQCLPIISYFDGLLADGKRGNNTLDDNTPHATLLAFPELMLEAEGDGLSL